MVSGLRIPANEVDELNQWHLIYYFPFLLSVLYDLLSMKLAVLVFMII